MNTKTIENGGYGITTFDIDNYKYNYIGDCEEFYYGTDLVKVCEGVIDVMNQITHGASYQFCKIYKGFSFVQFHWDSCDCVIYSDKEKPINESVFNIKGG